MLGRENSKYHCIDFASTRNRFEFDTAVVHNVTMKGDTMEENTIPKLLVSREEAEEKIQDRIEKGQQLHDQQIDSKDELDRAEADFGNWSNYNRTLLSKLFDNSSIVKEYVGFPFVGGWTNPSLNDQINWYQRDVAEKVNCLKGIQGKLELYDEQSETHQSNFGDEIFIVHGRDNGSKETVARFIEKLNLKATILHEQPSGGQTIIEKLEKYADKAGFAVVLLTPDDVGALKDRIIEGRRQTQSTPERCL